MKKHGLVLASLVVVVAASLAGAPWLPAPARTRTADAPAPIPPAPMPVLSGTAAIPALEREFEARLRAESGFEEAVYDAFKSQEDPMWMSFLQNRLAADPKRRNSPAWQDRFMGLVENDSRLERRKSALLFLQQAESIQAVRERLFRLAENGGDLRRHALVTLKGLPGRRLPDPRLAALAARIADHDPDPELRGLALRIEDDSDHAAGLLSVPHHSVRLQACQVVSSRECLERALARETHPEVRRAIESRLARLK